MAFQAVAFSCGLWSKSGQNVQTGKFYEMAGWARCILINVKRKFNNVILLRVKWGFRIRWNLCHVQLYCYYSSAGDIIFLQIIGCCNVTAQEKLEYRIICFVPQKQVSQTNVPKIFLFYCTPHFNTSSVMLQVIY